MELSVPRLWPLTLPPDLKQLRPDVRTFHVVDVVRGELQDDSGAADVLRRVLLRWCCRATSERVGVDPSASGAKLVLLSSSAQHWHLKERQRASTFASAKDVLDTGGIPKQEQTNQEVTNGGKGREVEERPAPANASCGPARGVEEGEEGGEERMEDDPWARTLGVHWRSQKAAHIFLKTELPSLDFTQSPQQFKEWPREVKHKSLLPAAWRGYRALGWWGFRDILVDKVSRHANLHIKAANYHNNCRDMCLHYD